MHRVPIVGQTMLHFKDGVEQCSGHEESSESIGQVSHNAKKMLR